MVRRRPSFSSVKIVVLGPRLWYTAVVHSFHRLSHRSLFYWGFWGRCSCWVRVPLSPPASPQPRILRLNLSAIKPSRSSDSLVRVLDS
jgi:hypothetical protein